MRAIDNVKVIKPPHPINFEQDGDSIKVFLAGSIELGKAVEWQVDTEDYFKNSPTKFTLFNPRREDWDESWIQDYMNPNFYQQVSWEMNALDKCDLIMMYFDPPTLSPISLLELGLYADSGKIVVCCADGFWRRGNVQMVCDKHNIPMFDTLLKTQEYIKNKFE
jgi:hypothetical protein